MILIVDNFDDVVRPHEAKKAIRRQHEGIITLWVVVEGETWHCSPRHDSV